MYKRILVPVDGSETSNKGLGEAIRLGKLTGATLRLVHVVDQVRASGGYQIVPVYSQDMATFMRHDGEQTLTSARDKVLAAGLHVETQLLETYAARVSALIHQELESWRADLVVIGTHGRRGLSRLFMGSDAEQVLRSSPVPVLLVPARDLDAG